MSNSEEDYAPWFKVIVDDEAEFWDDVVVLEAAGGRSGDKEWVEVKRIRVPDTQEAAAGKGAGACRTYDIQRHSIIMLTAASDVAPYIGLVDKLFRKRAAHKVRDDPDGPVYQLSQFGVHVYWLYRPTEVPDTAWGGFKRMQKRTKGRASYKLPGQKQFADEKHSEGQLLFSSHHTLHDYPDDKGILVMDGFLQECKVHWLGSSFQEVPRLEIHGSTLVSVQEPGFVVRGFLWCGAKDQPQFDDKAKRVYELEGKKWPDKETSDIAAFMSSQYKQQHEGLLAHNRAVLERFYAAKAAKQQSIPSDVDEDDGFVADDGTGTATATAGIARGRTTGTATAAAGAARVRSTATRSASGTTAVAAEGAKERTRETASAAAAAGGAGGASRGVAKSGRPIPLATTVPSPRLEGVDDVQLFDQDTQGDRGVLDMAWDDDDDD